MQTDGLDAGDLATAALAPVSGGVTTAIAGAVSLIGGVRATCWLALALVGWSWWAVQTWRLNDAREDAMAYDKAINTFELVQAQNLATIGVLQQRYSALVESRKLDKDEATEAAARASAQARRIQNSLKRTQQELANVYRKYPAARAWGNQGVDADVAGHLPRRR